MLGPNVLRGIIAATFALTLGVYVPGAVVLDAQRANAAREAAADHTADIARAKAEGVRQVLTQQANYFAMDTDAEPEWNGDAGPVHCWKGTACPEYRGD